MSGQYDHLEIRCPILGHPLTFHYCRTTINADPCRKLFDCWFERIPLQEYTQEFFDPQTISAIVQPPKPKMLSLLELVQRAQEVRKSNETPSETGIAESA